MTSETDAAVRRMSDADLMRHAAELLDDREAECVRFARARDGGAPKPFDDVVSTVRELEERAARLDTGGTGG